MPKSPLRVLAIDDDKLSLKILAHHLAATDVWAVELLPYSDWQEGLDDLARLDVDIVFLDYELGSSTGIEVLNSLRGSGDERPVIVLTGAGDESVAAEITRAGADDYLVKGKFSENGLERSIRHALDRYRLRLEKNELEDQLRRLATRDGLTGVFNRSSFDEFLPAECRRAVRTGSTLSLVLLDVDLFKPFNDTYGHPAGDDCLRRLAEVFQATLGRPGDRLARYGGEEFVVLLADTDREGARELAEQMRQRTLDLAIRHEASNVNEVVTISCGVAAVSSEVDDRRLPRLLLRAADRALYRAKHGGRNRVEIAEDWSLPGGSRLADTDS